MINTNIGGCYETKMGMITATVAGVYYISFGLFTSENKAFTVDLRKNNTEIVNRSKRLDVGTGRFTKFELTTLVYLQVEIIYIFVLRVVLLIWKIQNKYVYLVTY